MLFCLFSLLRNYRCCCWNDNGIGVVCFFVSVCRICVLCFFSLLVSVGVMIFFVVLICS